MGDDTITYRLEVESDLWQAIKGTVTRDVDLNDELVRRIEKMSFGERYERDTDSRGRLKLPKGEFADREDVVVLVLDQGEEASDG